jgi:hypothetical protein
MTVAHGLELGLLLGDLTALLSHTQVYKHLVRLPLRSLALL